MRKIILGEACQVGRPAYAEWGNVTQSYVIFFLKQNILLF
jgi:hypothetical protein